MDFIINKTKKIINKGTELIKNQFKKNEEPIIQTPDGLNEDDYEDDNEENIVYEGDFKSQLELDEETKNKLNEKGKKSTCYIINEENGEIGTGFFCKIQYCGEKIKVLFINYHFLNYDSIKNGKKIKIFYQDQEKIIEITDKRKFWTNTQYDFTCIEILNSDNIEDFFQIEEFKNENNYNNEDIAIIQYSNEKKMKINTNYLYKIKDNYKILHSVKTEKGCFGSPIILLLRDFKIIGIHKTYSKKEKINLGIYMKYIIEYIKNSMIGCEFDIKKENLGKEIQIVNFDENINIFFKFFFGNIEQYCDLYLNNKKILFCWKYKFEQEGKQRIDIVPKKLLEDMSYMFSECIYLTSLDLSNIITNKVTNMKNLLFNCSSLTSLNLSNFNTKKVKNMNSMFSGCSSLKKIDLSNFDTHNVEDMEYMFNKCSSLENIDLSNFNTKKVINMGYMFANCDKLISLDLSNFETNNVTNMKCIFKECRSLKYLNIINFNTNNVKDIDDIFDKINMGCKIISEDLKIREKYKSIL